MLSISVQSFDLQFSKVFAIAGNTRSGTEALFLKLEGNGVVGHGQAAFPPYMKPKRTDNLLLLQQLAEKGSRDPEEWAARMEDIRWAGPDGLPALAALDMAWHDVQAQLAGMPLWHFLKLPDPARVQSCFTIGLSSAKETAQALTEARGYGWIKFKFDADMDRIKGVLALAKKHSELPIGVDFNQAFRSRDAAAKALEVLAIHAVLLAEQPMITDREEDHAWLKDRIPVPLFGDESIQTETDVVQKRELFDGVNIKLMKCGGLQPALRMQGLAKEQGMKTLLGCMAESALSTTAAAHISGLFDYADLDGHSLITNDLYRGLTLPEGRVVLREESGIGVEEIG